MEQIRTYYFEGLELKIPLLYDRQSNIYIEDYSHYLDHPTYTPQGHPVMFAGEDACSHAEEQTPGGCPDCGSCRFYRRAAPHTWIGVCGNERNRKQESYSS